jgi:hypothetical protein
MTLLKFSATRTLVLIAPLLFWLVAGVFRSIRLRLQCRCRKFDLIGLPYGIGTGSVIVYVRRSAVIRKDDVVF